MNYDAMTDRELLHYLDLYSTDPLIQRLVQAVSNVRGTLIDDLESEGMDILTWTFEAGEYSPGEYIQHLRREKEYYEDEYNGLEYKYQELEGKNQQLTTRAVMDFITEACVATTNAEKTAERLRKENEDLKQKIDMWGRLNQVRVTG